MDLVTLYVDVVVIINSYSPFISVATKRSDIFSEKYPRKNKYRRNNGQNLYCDFLSNIL